MMKVGQRLPVPPLEQHGSNAKHIHLAPLSFGLLGPPLETDQSQSGWGSCGNITL